MYLIDWCLFRLQAQHMITTLLQVFRSGNRSCIRVQRSGTVLKLRHYRTRITDICIGSLDIPDSDRGISSTTYKDAVLMREGK